jgi:hypothetical protein
MMVTLFLVVASVPAYARTIDCYSFYDNDPYTYGNISLCYYAPGDVCFQCVDVQRGTGCASARLCDPDAVRLPVGKEQFVQLPPAQSTGRVQVAAARQGQTSRSSHSNSIRPVSMRVARLNAGNLL